MENRIRRAVEEYRLTKTEKIKGNEDRAVLSGVSEDYGDVILKLDTDILQADLEYAVMESFEGRGYCRVHRFDTFRDNAGRKYSAYLEERILPGTPLRKEPSPERRVEVFCHCFHAIHKDGFYGTEYLQWLEDALRFVLQYYPGTDVETMARKAHAICVDIYKRYPGCIQLHGDLHHDNILLRLDGSYAVIDPKVVTGPAILDVPRFLYNEIGMGTGDQEAHIRKIMELLSNALTYPVSDMGNLLYMETVLANIWFLEDGMAFRCEDLELAGRFLSE